MARDVATCAEIMRALVTDFEPDRPGSLADLRIGVAAGVEIGGAELVELPPADGIAPAFMREVAETHAGLFGEHRELYGANVATKVERCLAVTDAEYGRAEQRRAELREAYADLFTELDLLLTPTVPIPPPPADVDELEIREQAITFTFALNAVGAPALALPFPGAGPASSLQVVAAPGRDALVLAAGVLLERRSAGSGSRVSP